jgi:glucose dehydrogenase
MQKSLLVRICAAALLVFALETISTGQQSTKASPDTSKGEWPVYGGDKSFRRYSPLDLINRANVKDLHVVWTRGGIDPLIKDKFPDLSPANYFKGTPVMINGILYAPNGVGLVEASMQRQVRPCGSSSPLSQP